jgi:hypothetical protein
MDDDWIEGVCVRCGRTVDDPVAAEGWATYPASNHAVCPDCAQLTHVNDTPAEIDAWVSDMDVLYVHVGAITVRVNFGEIRDGEMHLDEVSLFSRPADPAWKLVSLKLDKGMTMGSGVRVYVANAKAHPIEDHFRGNAEPESD